MLRVNRHFVWSCFLSLVVVVNLLNVTVALADDGTPPPPPTEEATQPPVEPTETPVGEATPEPVEPAVGQEAVPAPEDQAPAEGEAAGVLQILQELPDNTEIVVLDENGSVLPLGSQLAAEIVLDTDPMWCPVIAGTPTLPGGAGCTINFASGQALIDNMDSSNPATTNSTYERDGIIYFTANPGGSFTLVPGSGNAIDTNDYNALKGYSLTLRGGWNGSTASPAFSGQSNFGSSTLTIGTSGNPWVGNITLTDFTFNGVSSSNAVTVYTTSGNITLNNVDVAQQSGTNYTARLDSNSGNITVQNGSSFDGNNSGSNQNRGFSADTGGSITITGTAGTPITFTDARGCFSFFGFCLSDSSVNYNGATLIAPTVTLNNVTASNNDLNGIEIQNANTITLNNVIVNNNGTGPFFLTGPQGSGIRVNGTGSTLVNVTGGSYTNNDRYGLEVFNGSIIVLLDPTCSGNRYPGPDPSTCYNILPLDLVPPVLSLPTDITVPATSPAGAIVDFTALAVDEVDGSLPVTCTPPSGSLFPVGTTTVTCTASDAAENEGGGTFTVTVSPYIAPSSNRTNSTSLSGLILVTGGEVIDLDCFSVVNAFGIIVKFHNLCDHQAVLNEVGADALPGPLPTGYTFVQGLDVDVLGDGQLLDVLPNGAGIEMDFPLPGGTEFTVLFWNGSQWVEITQSMNESELATVLSTDAENELYRMNSSNAFLHKILTTEKTGLFILVRK